jgi:hypothetical protein
MNLGTFCPLEKNWHILTPIVCTYQYHLTHHFLLGKTINGDLNDDDDISRKFFIYCTFVKRAQNEPEATSIVAVLIYQQAQPI